MKAIPLTFVLDEPLSDEAVQELIKNRSAIKAHSRYNQKLKKAVKKFIKEVDKDSFNIVRVNEKVVLLKIEQRLFYELYKLESFQVHDLSRTVVEFVLTKQAGVKGLSVKNEVGFVSDELNELIRMAIANTNMPTVNKDLRVVLELGRLY